MSDPYVARGIGQFTALTTGLIWFLYNFSSSLLFRYLPIFIYIFIMTVGAIFSSAPEFVLLELLSLLSVILFSIAYCESSSLSAVEKANGFVKISITLLAIVCAVSLVTIKLFPGIAYEKIQFGGLRYRGLFSKSAMLGVSSGILVGMSWYGIKNKLAKYSMMIIGLACMLLTQSRTFWVATAISMFVTNFFYYRYKLLTIAVPLCVISILVLFYFAADLSIDKKQLNKYARIDSVTNLTGRLDLWKRALDNFSKSPFLGAGFTRGSELMKNQSSLNGHIQINNDSRYLARTTTHSGYIQALLDGGIIGFSGYIAIIVYSLLLYFKHQRIKKHSTHFYLLLYLVISNFTENTIYAASVFHCYVYWFVVVFSMSLTKENDQHVIDDLTVFSDNIYEQQNIKQVDQNIHSNCCVSIHS